MKCLIKFAVFALGVAVIAFSIRAVINYFCTERCCCPDDEDMFYPDI